MPLPKEIVYTVDDIYNLPEGTRAELIDGQIYYHASPSTTHQRISGWLFKKIINHIDDHKGSCEVFPAPFAVILSKDEEIYVEPDISVICDPDKLDDRGCNGAPDFIIEIISPSTKQIDYYTKLVKYRNAGVREYWIVDPLKKKVVAYDMVNDDGPITYTFNDQIKVNIFDNLTIDFSELDI